MRIKNLDYLRGLAAVGIMIYHYLSWTLKPFGSGDMLGRVGIYGVSIFYVLSGLTLHYVYFDKMNDFKDVWQFFKKRFFRIYPLLWLVIIITALRGPVSLWFLFLNFTGLFGFIGWDQSLGVGVWSIGNELVFYTFFPVFVFLFKGRKFLFWLLAAAILSVYLYFAWTSYADKSTYVNPLNQLFLFLGGFLIGKLNVKHPLAWFFAGVALFVFYPAYGDQVNLLSGWARVAFTSACLLICAGVYKMKLPSFKSLSILGEISYSVYLLHPIIYWVFGVILGDFSHRETIRLCLSFAGTIAVSWVVYNYYERFFIRLGARRFSQPLPHTSN